MKERTARQKKMLKRLTDRQSRLPGLRSVVRADKFGMATTHWISWMRAFVVVSNPCPLLLIGLPLSAVEDYSAATAEL